MSLEEAKGFYHEGLDQIEMDFVKLLVIQGTANVSLVSKSYYVRMFGNA